MAVGYLTSSSLISTIKREGMIPTSQSTFSDSDFLAIANQEMRIGLVPSIMQFHEEYYARDSAPVPLVENQNTYAIPYRAVGGKLRNLYYLDSNNNLGQMSRISPEDRPYYQQTNLDSSNMFFFLQGNEVVLVPDVGSNASGSLVFSFYMRPNELVDEDRVATIESIAVTDEEGSITAISTASPPVVTSAAHGLSTGNIITISDSNCTPSVDGSWEITVIDANTFSIDTTVSVAGTQGNWEYSVTTYTLDQIPDNFTTQVMYDILQTNPGHKTYSYDIYPLAVDNVNMTMIFNTVDVRTATYGTNVGSAPIVGDYIAFAGECIIPQAPSDLHDVLAQRVVLRCLQALGDQPGYQVAQSKLGEMEKYSGMLVDNRTEGNPQKINNLRGLLRSSKIRNRWS
jgi:hypothetical protein